MVILSKQIFQISGIAIAFIINMLLTYGNIIKTNLSNDSWLNFWGSYSSGIFAVVVGYLAIIYSNRNNEKAILQQEKLLIRQQNHYCPVKVDK